MNNGGLMKNFVTKKEFDELLKTGKGVSGTYIGKKVTCFDCKNHFMSDCYLECQLHNRINQSDICKDFSEK